MSGKKTGLAKGNKVRLDVVVFHDKECRKPWFAIEVKPKRTNGWRSDWAKTQQHMLYSLLDLPLVVACGQREVDAVIKGIAEVASLPNGLHWARDLKLSQ